jgi:hypothetical protein
MVAVQGGKRRAMRDHRRDAMDFTAGVSMIDAAQVADLKAAVESAGIDAFNLTTAKVTNKPGFFEAMRSALPMDPPIGIVRPSWDALDDSLWGGIDALDVPRVAIFWTDSIALREADPETYTNALRTFSDVTESLMDLHATVGNRTAVHVYIV